MGRRSQVPSPDAWCDGVPTPRPPPPLGSHAAEPAYREQGWIPQEGSRRWDRRSSSPSPAPARASVPLPVWGGGSSSHCAAEPRWAECQQRARPTPPSGPPGSGVRRTPYIARPGHREPGLVGVGVPVGKPRPRRWRVSGVFGESQGPRGPRGARRAPRPHPRPQPQLTAAVGRRELDGWTDGWTDR